MQRPNRQRLRQGFFVFPVALGIGSPARISQSPTLERLFTSFLVSNPAVNGVPIYVGDQTVSAANLTGIEVPPGATVPFSIAFQRQQYETQEPLVDIRGGQLRSGGAVSIPIPVFELYDWFIAINAPVGTCTVMAFPEAFV